MTKLTKSLFLFCRRLSAIVTSPTGAVIRDILHVLARRFPEAHVIINPVRVQGEGAAQEVSVAIKEFNELGNADVIILARGGGSLEDLWCFNEEKVARAIYDSAIPIISAIGHETDYTIADFVADRRAPTPSAAAEIVLPVRLELNERIEDSLRHLWRSLKDQVPQYEQRLDDLREGLARALDQKIRSQGLYLEGIYNQLKELNPLAILKRGYSISFFEGTEKVLRSVRELKKGDKVCTRLSEGTFVSDVIEIRP